MYNVYMRHLSELQYVLYDYNFHIQVQFVYFSIV